MPLSPFGARLYAALAHNGDHPCDILPSEAKRMFTFTSLADFLWAVGFIAEQQRVRLGVPPSPPPVVGVTVSAAGLAAGVSALEFPVADAASKTAYTLRVAGDEVSLLLRIAPDNIPGFVAGAGRIGFPLGTSFGAVLGAVLREASRRSSLSTQPA